MNQINKKTPEIRFPGFTDDWEQRKWSDTVDISTEMVDPTSGEYDDMPHIAPGNIESFTGRVLDNVKSVKEEQLISGKFRFRPGDVVYGKINPQLGKYFYASVDGLTSADAYVFNGKNGITQTFLFSLLQTQDFFKYSVSVSKRSGMPKINRDELNAYSFLAPGEKEQEQIGNFLLDLDNLITLHQRKCEKIVELKKCLLQKMFPQKNASVPDIRFPGFTGDWEQRKLCEVSEKICVGFVGTCEKYYTDASGIPMYRTGNLNGLKLNQDDLKYVTREFHEQNKKSQLRKGDILIARHGDSGKAVNYELSEEANCLNIVIIRPDLDKCNYQFLADSINSPAVSQHIKSLSAGSTQAVINTSEIEKLDIIIPANVEEQNKIAGLLNGIDNLITLHQRKCNALKDLKKSMLKKMFI